ncbi:MAG TPA: hypothetical protein VNW15_05830 [Rhizomicrobium sp.]|jgi:hypothetical protein|nr:hypothetical protein [Rhizomicrobium sp.]
MAKAQVVTKDGTTIMIEGTPDEVSLMIERLSAKKTQPSGRAVKPQRTKSAKRTNRIKTGPAALIAQMIEAAFFKKPRGLGEIRSDLAQNGYFYPRTTLSPAVLRLVRSRALRRIKDGGAWKYVCQ